MKICVLASGSKGNVSYIEANNTRILIDVGTNITNIEEKLNEIGTSLSEINYIFISHTHTDHTSSLDKIIKKYKPIICISIMMRDSLPSLKDYENIIIYDNPISFNDINVTFIKTSHDAPDSRGFLVEYDSKSVVYVTDTGYLNSKYFNILKNKNVYIFESNHDPETLINGPYPKWLQSRILSDVGHLSNDASAIYLTKLIGPNTKKVFLAHLSEKNNKEEIALSVFRNMMEEHEIEFDNVSVAYQDKITEMIEL